MPHAALVNVGSLPTFAADAPRQKSGVTLSVCFLRTHPFSLQVQRMSANRRFCGKTACCFRRKLRFEERASAFPIRLCAFAAVQEKS